MMNLKKHLSICIVIISFFFHGKTQTVEETFYHAQKLYNQSNYSACIKNLRRVIFFDTQLSLEAYHLLGDCYSKTNNFEKAYYYYTLELENQASDSIKDEIRFDIVALYLKFLEPTYALHKLYSINPDSNFYFSSKKAFYLSMAFFQLKNYKKSKENFLKSIAPANDYTISQVDSLYKLAVKNDRFNTRIPMLLSTIPGLGQLYIGEYGAALNSVMLTGATLTLYFIALTSLSFVDAVLAVLPWFHRYYTGGLLHTKELADIKKSNRQVEYYNTLLELYLEHANSVETK